MLEEQALESFQEEDRWGGLVEVKTESDLDEASEGRARRKGREEG